jgi:signal transduction histidine kinase
MGRRRLAIALACGVAGAFQAVHGLAFDGTLELASVAFATGVIAIELIALTALFDAQRAHARAAPWSVVHAGALGLGLGLALAFGAAAVPAGAMHRLPARIVAEIGLFDGLLGLGLWALAVGLPSALHDARTRALDAERLRARADLERLRAHVQPHFLLNTLHAIAGLVTEDPHGARELIASLGDLLRASLADGGDAHTIADEVAWLRRYAEIMELRYRGTVRFRWEIADGTSAVRLPRLLLQPLVENAVKHRALRRRDGGEIAVRTAITDDGTVTCVVEDDGPGPEAAREGALGLSLVTQRLAVELGGRAAFRLERVDGRTRSIVELPAEAAP